jgi:hypothetical protein
VPKNKGNYLHTITLKHRSLVDFKYWQHQSNIAKHWREKKLCSHKYWSIFIEKKSSISEMIIIVSYSNRNTEWIQMKYVMTWTVCRPSAYFLSNFIKYWNFTDRLKFKFFCLIFNCFLKKLLFLNFFYFCIENNWKGVFFLFSVWTLGWIELSGGLAWVSPAVNPIRIISEFG